MGSVIWLLLGALDALAGGGGGLSLSVYLLESVVVSTLPYGYGFGLFGGVGPLAGQGLAIAVWLGLSAFAVLWMRVARFGPFEWLLRSFTFGKL